MPIKGKASRRQGLAMAVALGALAVSATAAQAGPNLLTDGDFESATSIAIDSTFRVDSPTTHNIWGDRQGWSKQPGGPTGIGQYARQFNSGSTDELFQGVPLASACVAPGARVQVSFDHKTAVSSSTVIISTGTRYRVLAFGATGVKGPFAPWTPTDATSLLPGGANAAATVDVGRTSIWASHTSVPFTVPNPVPTAIGLGIEQGFQGGQTAVDGQGVDNVSMSVTSYPVSVDVDPNTLSLRSSGRWVTAYITLPDCLDPEDIDTSTVKLAGIDNVAIAPITASRSDVQNGTLMVKFDRQALIAALGGVTGDRTLEIEGLLQGEDTIRVIP